MTLEIARCRAASNQLFTLKFHYNFTRNANSTSIVCCLDSELKFVHVIHEVGEPHEGRSFVRQVTANTGGIS